jgi:hypothetical protein
MKPAEIRKIIDAWDKTFHLRLSEMAKQYLVLELSKPARDARPRKDPAP